MATPRKPWQRTGADNRVRGRKGQLMRARRLARTNGLCERCDERGVTRLATKVDHIKPLAQDGADADENTRNLCDPCHDEVTAEQFAKAEAVKGRGVGRDGRPTSADHPWNRLAHPPVKSLGRAPADTDPAMRVRRE